MYKVSKKATKRKTNKKVKSVGYSFSLNLKSKKNMIAVDTIAIYSPDIKEYFLQKQFDRAFKKLFKLVMDIDEDSTEGNIGMILNEILKSKKILKDKYKNQVSNESYRKYFQKLNFLENEVKEKIIMQLQIKEERGMSR